MIVEAKVAIHGSREAIWEVITDVERAADTIRGIDKVEILEKPESGLVGLKWRETRTLFGKTATEVMWITDATENVSIETRAESHGFVYLSAKRIHQQDGNISLTMTHDSRPQGFMAKLLAVPLGFVFKGAMRKAILQDLEDIKNAVEQRADGRSA